MKQKNFQPVELYHLANLENFTRAFSSGSEKMMPLNFQPEWKVKFWHKNKTKVIKMNRKVKNKHYFYVLSWIGSSLSQKVINITRWA